MVPQADVAYGLVTEMGGTTAWRASLSEYAPRLLVKADDALPHSCWTGTQEMPLRTISMVATHTEEYPGLTKMNMGERLPAHTMVLLHSVREVAGEVRADYKGHRQFYWTGPLLSPSSQRLAGSRGPSRYYRARTRTRKWP